ncbi:MAG: IgGFc-binding protein [Pseudomonadota bacterium]
MKSMTAIVIALALTWHGCASDEKIELFDGDTDTQEDTADDPATDRDVVIPDAEDEEYVDPTSCAEAAYRHTYIGCDFWPTILPNVVGEWFDYAVVVSNTSAETAEILIERDGAMIDSGTVPPSGLTKFFLPWVAELKHWTGMCDTDPGGDGGPLYSKRVPGGAYHLTSTQPVTVYQFNPIEYGPQGGPAGKDWGGCDCMFGCNSYTNDASLLLPSTTATGNYRITAPAGQNSEDVKQPGYFSVTGIQDGTLVKVKVAPEGEVAGGDDIPAAGPGAIFEFTIDRGEVVRIAGTNTTDLSGSVLNAGSPILVMSGAPCHYMPDEYGACDHMEESVFPAESLGSHYFVAVPTNARGVPIGHVVRLYGNEDGTTVYYPSGPPTADAPTTLTAGRVYDLGIVDEDFEIVGDKSFAVTSFLLGSGLSDPGHLLDYKGDPAQSNVLPVEQYRENYVFLAPDDYDFSFADVVMPDGTQVLLDGIAIAVPATPISSGYSVLRIDVSMGGAHTLDADAPVSLQVMGYGFATSYHYPGGGNMQRITAPPLI